MITLLPAVIALLAVLLTGVVVHDISPVQRHWLRYVAVAEVTHGLFGCYAGELPPAAQESLAQTKLASANSTTPGPVAYAP